MSVGVAENPHQTAFFSRAVPRFPADCSSFEYPSLLRNELNSILHNNQNSYHATSCSNYVNILTNLKGQVVENIPSSGYSAAGAMGGRHQQGAVVSNIIGRSGGVKRGHGDY
jgi:hypothetical protein